MALTTRDILPYWLILLFCVSECNTCIINSIKSSGKLPIQVDDAQQVFTTTALELSQPKEEKIRIANPNNHHDKDESAPPLPPKALAGE